MNHYYLPFIPINMNISLYFFLSHVYRSVNPSVHKSIFFYFGAISSKLQTSVPLQNVSVWIPLIRIQYLFAVCYLFWYKIYIQINAHMVVYIFKLFTNVYTLKIHTPIKIIEYFCHPIMLTYAFFQSAPVPIPPRSNLFFQIFKLRLLLQF